MENWPLHYFSSKTGLNHFSCSQVNLEFRLHNQWMKLHIPSWSPLLAAFFRTASYLAIKWAYVCFELFASNSSDSVMTLWCRVYWSHSLIWGKNPGQWSAIPPLQLWLHSYRWRQYYNYSAHAGLRYVLQNYFWINCSAINYLFWPLYLKFHTLHLTVK